MRKINTLAELRAEQQLLRLRKTYLETEIKKGFAEIKEDLAPLKLLTKGAKDMLVNKDHSILGASAGLAADLLTRNTFVKNSGFLAKLIVPLLVKNAASNIVDNNKERVTGWIETLIEKFTNKKPAEENA